MKIESSYPKDMDDPRWFDRDFGRDKENILPEWTAIVIFFPALVVHFLGRSFSEIVANISTIKQTKTEKKLIKKQEELAILEINSSTSSLERR